jgi:hypothetical protein
VHPPHQAGCYRQPRIATRSLAQYEPRPLTARSHHVDSQYSARPRAVQTYTGGHRTHLISPQVMPKHGNIHQMAMSQCPSHHQMLHSGTSRQTPIPQWASCSCRAHPRLVQQAHAYGSSMHRRSKVSLVSVTRGGVLAMSPNSPRGVFMARAVPSAGSTPCYLSLVCINVTFDNGVARNRICNARSGIVHQRAH